MRIVGSLIVGVLLVIVGLIVESRRNTEVWHTLPVGDTDTGP